MSNKLGYWEVEEEVPTGGEFHGVFTRSDGKGFLAHHSTLSGSSTANAKTREQAQEELDKTIQFHREFWLEKVAWKDNGDRTPEGSLAIRINGRHFVTTPGSVGQGFGGRRFKWVMKSNPEVVLESRDMWSQGYIPQEFRDVLHDNAEWVENTSAVQ